MVDPCPVAPIVGVIFGRWPTHVPWVLIHHGRLRFTEVDAARAAHTGPSVS